MTYRLVTMDDVPALADMRWEYNTHGALPVGDRYQGFIRRCTQFLQRVLESGKWAIWVVEHDSEIVSHIYMQVIEKVPNRP